eukprot:TRINITY_DN7566_c0_g1_i4.p1 TRINITY_DN7566_c0_g1~~TRINITY_DN7566_c0_g1_i4.p1  ORF type:complete len:409 (+),score=17.29 TRINITY_DN7566_c0_g1_i4:221-1447(+)
MLTESRGKIFSVLVHIKELDTYPERSRSKTCLALQSEMEHEETNNDISIVHSFSHNRSDQAQRSIAASLFMSHGSIFSRESSPQNDRRAADFPDTDFTSPSSRLPISHISESLTNNESAIVERSALFEYNESILPEGKRLGYIQHFILSPQMRLFENLLLKAKNTSNKEYVEGECAKIENILLPTVYQLLAPSKRENIISESSDLSTDFDRPSSWMNNADMDIVYEEIVRLRTEYDRSVQDDLGKLIVKAYGNATRDLPLKSVLSALTVWFLRRGRKNFVEQIWMQFVGACVFYLRIWHPEVVEPLNSGGARIIDERLGLELIKRGSEDDHIVLEAFEADFDSRIHHDLVQSMELESENCMKREQTAEIAQILLQVLETVKGILYQLDNEDEILQIQYFFYENCRVRS